MSCDSFEWACERCGRTYRNPFFTCYPREFWLNVTYNYARHYHCLGERGIREIYGKTGAESIPMLKAAALRLGDDVSDDYWEATDGNAKRALLQLLAMARMRPDGVWDGD